VLEQAPPLDSRRCRHVQIVGEGWHQVDLLDWRRHPSTTVKPVGKPDDQRDIGEFGVKAVTMKPGSVVEELLAVIRHEDDH
jgi:hypothetical protein